MMITVELLDALLSPEAERRKQAETYYEQIKTSTSATDRCTSLLTIFVQQQQSQSSQKQILPLHIQQFILVLLRRDILKLNDTGYLKNNLLPNLLQAFSVGGGTSSTFSNSQNASRVRTAIGHCIAEVVAVISWFANSTSSQDNNNDAMNVMQTILQTIATSVSSSIKQL